LKDLNEGDAVSAFLRSTTFKLPPSPATSVIMVGAGTGIAPLRGMIAHLSEAKKQVP
jgi:sulfite reductase alpha subunit-like flavoprotein